jgi:hypothetical protein
MVAFEITIGTAIASTRRCVIARSPAGRAVASPDLRSSLFARAQASPFGIRKCPVACAKRRARLSCQASTWTDA